MKKYFVTIFTIVLATCFIISGLQGCTKKKTLEADIVIIGGGGAGTVAALKGIQSGAKKVILLEKEGKLGGTSATAGGSLWGLQGGAPVQGAQGDGTMQGAQGRGSMQGPGGGETSTDEAFKQHMEFNHYDRVDPKIVRAFMDKTADTYKWLEDNGADLQGWMGAPHEGFVRTINYLGEKIETEGVQVMLNTSAEKILRGPDGKITGVRAKDKDGKTILINTKAVILATGGFTGNEELLYKYFPEYWDSDAYHTEAVKTNTGDGITLASDAGAGLNRHATLVREPAYTFYEGENNFNRLCQQADVWVNKRGERFQNETWEGNASVNPLLKQPGKIGFALFDDKSVQRLNNRLNSQGQDVDLKEFYEAEDKKGEWVKVSESWDDIASWIGADPEELKATVEEYNSFCAQGRDAVFGKDPKFLNALSAPPFYAVKFGPLMIDTYGPVRINERMEVLDKQDNPIPGFYAGGAICSGIQGRDYNLFGSALGFAVISGRIAAENAAKYISGK